ncbi:MAG: hypothetical protein L6Q84_31380 [Polyangiaceae bacterium]|nr:hypothetical protein [Polyangiaceae bacterium]
MARFVLSLKSAFARPVAWRSVFAMLVALTLTASCSGDDDGRSPKKPAPPGTDRVPMEDTPRVDRDARP